jgi:hypothetical protein
MLFLSRYRNIKVILTTGARSLQTHFACIIPIGCQVLPEAHVLLVNCVLANMRQEEDQTGGEEGKG